MFQRVSTVGTILIKMLMLYCFYYPIYITKSITISSVRTMLLKVLLSVNGKSQNCCDEKNQSIKTYKINKSKINQSQSI